MSAEQLALFEPCGSELVALVRSKVAAAEALHRQADVMALRAFLSAARACDRSSKAANEAAQVFESALQFEELAGLV